MLSSSSQGPLELLDKNYPLSDGKLRSVVCIGKDCAKGQTAIPKRIIAKELKSVRVESRRHDDACAACCLSSIATTRTLLLLDIQQYREYAKYNVFKLPFGWTTDPCSRAAATSFVGGISSKTFFLIILDITYLGQDERNLSRIQTE